MSVQVRPNLEFIGWWRCCSCHAEFRTEELAMTHECEEEKPDRIACSRCGKPTTWDATYQDLCYRCIRAENE